MACRRSFRGIVRPLPLVWTLTAALPLAADHPRDVASALADLQRGKGPAADEAFLRGASGPGLNQLLCLYELGGLRHFRGDYKGSSQSFAGADAVARGYEGQAVISAGAAARNAEAVLFNDSVRRYEGSCFEKVMARTLDAMNYLFGGSLEDALVETRKAEEYQVLERARRARDVRRTTEAPPRGAGLDSPAVAAKFGRMVAQARKVRNSYENAFTYFLSSQLNLARGSEGFDDALVDVRRAYELAPQVSAVRAAFQEIAKAQGGPALDEAAALPPAASPPVPVNGPSGCVVVVFEAGLVPRLEEARLDLPVDNRLYSMAVPIYRDFPPPLPPLQVTTAAGTFQTERILDSRALAVKALEERLPGILARGLAGALAKGKAQEEVEARYGPFAGLFAKVASAVVTSADTRSWLSLPGEVQVARLDLPAGPGKVTLQADGPPETVSLDIGPGSRTFILVRSLPGFHRTDVVTLGRRGAPEPVLPPAAAPPGPPAAPPEPPPAALPPRPPQDPVVVK